MATPAVFLDRDNTLIPNDDDLGDPEQVMLIQGVASAIASLRGLGYYIVVVTNQGGVARGKYSEEDVELVHQRINDLVRTNSGARIDRFYYCPYHPEGTVEKYQQEHPWRKPAPGMLLQATKDLDIDLSQSWMIGDQERDVEAGAAAGVRTILLDPAAQQEAPLRHEAHHDHTQVPTFTARNLVEAARVIAQQRKPDGADEMEESAATPTEPPQRPAREFRPWNARETEDQPESKPFTTPPEAPAVSKPAPAAPNNGAQANLLKQILHELRAQRGAGSDFAYTKMLAVVLQMLALVCFVGAFWMAGTEIDLFIRWMASALMVQFATIAMLLFGR